jgi:hypothetical protein
LTGVNKTSLERDRHISSIRALKKERRSDKEIMESLGISLRMYQDYIKRIREEDKIMWDTIIKHELESEILSVRDTMLYCVRYAKR